jgi:hypothetical protein
LFVIDDSGSMREEQESLARNFPLFMRELEEAGLPDLHVGIVSIRLRGPGAGQGDCTARGDQGASGCGLAAGCRTKPAS